VSLIMLHLSKKNRSHFLPLKNGFESVLKA